MPTMSALLYNWKIAGEAGHGVMNTGGPIFAKTVKRAGFYVFIYTEYPSLIRGGHNTVQVAIDKDPIGGPYYMLDQLVALNVNTIVWHQNEVKPGGHIIYDPNVVKFKSESEKLIDNTRIPTLTGDFTIRRARKETRFRDDVTYIEVAFQKIAETAGGNKLMLNVASIGAALALMSRAVTHNEDLLLIGKGVLQDIFGRKGKEIIEANQRTFEAGFRAVS